MTATSISKVANSAIAINIGNKPISIQRSEFPKGCSNIEIKKELLQEKIDLIKAANFENCPPNYFGASKGSLVKQKEEYEKYGKKNTYYFKYTTAGRTQYASIGGKASYASGNCKEFLFWASPDGRKIRASLGGKSHFGKKWVNKDGIVKFVHESKLNEYISSGWSIGSLRKWVNKCGEIKQINQSELESYLGDGWSVGKSRKS
jgi:hypothetical protein